MRGCGLALFLVLVGIFAAVGVAALGYVCYVAAVAWYWQ